MLLSGLYVLTDASIYAYASWPERIEKIILGGASIIQLRDKQLSDDELYPIACTIQEVCAYHHIPLILNDRVSLAKKLAIDGVHIGKHDGSLRHAREYLGNNMIIGASCYRSIPTAIQASKTGADYVAFGRMFPSHTKPNAPRCGLSILRQAKNISTIPICAIGGINSNNVQHIINAGAHMIAVTHAVFNALYPQQAANTISQKYIMHAE